MSGSFSITISSLSAHNIGGSETSEIKELVDRAMQVFVSTNGQAITFKDRNGTVAGTLSWTPVIRISAAAIAIWANRSHDICRADR